MSSNDTPARTASRASTGVAIAMGTALVFLIAARAGLGRNFAG